MKHASTFGIDIGTTSVAALAIDAAGTVTASSTRAHCADIAGFPPGIDEQDPRKLLDTAKAVLADVGWTPDAPTGWTGQMHGVVGIDSALEPVTNLVTWRDARRYAGPVMSDWAREGRGIFRCLTAPGFVKAALTGRCDIDETFLHSWHVEGCDFPESWLPDLVPGSMLGDNQAGVFAARFFRPDAAVVNLGTSGQLSVVGEGRGGERRPYFGTVLRCHASRIGGQAFAALRKRLGLSWDELNRRADEPEVAAVTAAIADDLAGDLELAGVNRLVGVGNALRLNPALRRAVERRFGLPCELLDIPEMAAYGAARAVQS